MALQHLQLLASKSGKKPKHVFRFFQTLIEKLSSSFCIVNMSKHFRKVKECNNQQIHEQWNITGRDQQIVNLRKKGLTNLAKVFEEFLQNTLPQRSAALHITNICRSCLQTCYKKRAFTKYLEKKNTDKIQQKVI